MIIPQDIRDFFEEIPQMALATVDGNGMPNVVVIASKIIINDSTIWTIDTFHDKTLHNILNNGKVALSFWNNTQGYQIKGTAKVYTQGAIFEKGRDWILTIKPKKIVKSVIEIKVSDVFYLTPNYTLAGQRVPNKI